MTRWPAGRMYPSGQLGCRAGKIVGGAGQRDAGGNEGEDPCHEQSYPAPEWRTTGEADLFGPNGLALSGNDVEDIFAP